MHILYGLGLIVLGILLVVYSTALFRMFGQLELAERYLGQGGTNSAWKLIGLALLLGGFWELVH